MSCALDRSNQTPPAEHLVAAPSPPELKRIWAAGLGIRPLKDMGLGAKAVLRLNKGGDRLLWREVPEEPPLP